MKNQKMEACPFCGCEYINLNFIRDTGKVYLECPKCRIETRLFETLEDAVEAWNQRATNTIRCEDCVHCETRNNEELYCHQHAMTVSGDYFCADGAEGRWTP